MKDSSVNAELLVRTGRYIEGKLAFADLADWVSDHEEHWAGLPADSLARILAGTLMLAAYEIDDGVREVESVKDLLSETTLKPAHPVTQSP